MAGQESNTNEEKTEESKKPKQKKVFKPYKVLPNLGVAMVVARSKPNKKATISNYIGSGKQNRTSDHKLTILEEKGGWGKVAEGQWVHLSNFYMCG